MPTIDFLGSTSGNLSTVGNYSGGALPSAGDTLRFRAQTAMPAINAGLAALALIALDRLIRDRRYTGKIGVDASNPAQFRATRFDYDGPADDEYITGNFGTVNATGVRGGKTLTLQTITTSAELRLANGTYVLQASSLFGDIYIERGRLVIPAGCTQAAGKTLYLGADAVVETETTLVNVMPLARGSRLVTKGTAGITGRIVLIDGVLFSPQSSGTVNELINGCRQVLGFKTRDSKPFTITTYRYVSEIGDDIPLNDDLVTIGSGSRVSIESGD